LFWVVFDEVLAFEADSCVGHRSSPSLRSTRLTYR
jgi:hypothetical protein